MKYQLTALLILSAVIALFGQRDQLILSFTGEHYAQNIALDSVLITNVTQNCDTILYFPDTILVLDIVTGVDVYENFSQCNFTLYQNFPNPFSHKTTFGLYLRDDDEIMITVFNLKGQQLYRFSDFINSGEHFFVFYPGNERQYVLNIRSSNGVQSMLLNSTENNTTNKHCLISYAYSGKTMHKNSGSFFRESFQFLPGDSLLFVAYATYADTIPCSDAQVDSPETSTNYAFDLTEGMPCPGNPIIFHCHGHYHTIQIGERCWLKENLNTGYMIDGADTMKLNGSAEKYCYDNNEDNCDEYGGLYQWREVMQYSNNEGSKGMCPQGWHIPTVQEWLDLGNYLSGEEHAGGYLKEPATHHWNEPNFGATNLSGFTALPSGKNNLGIFSGIGVHTHFFSSTSVSTDSVTCFRLNHNTGGFYSENTLKKQGNSARCIKDEK